MGRTRNEHVGSSEYHAWEHIKQRCSNPKDPAYKHYGGRGIKICKNWQDNSLNFVNDMGAKPSKEYEVDRIDNNKHYSCGYCDQCIKEGWLANCKWATRKQQVNNTRRNKLLTYKDKTQNYRQWETELGFSRNTIHRRINILGWSVEKTLTEPIDKNCSHRANPKTVTFKGETKTCTGWDAVLGYRIGLVHFRIFRQGWNIEKSLTTPPKGNVSNV